MANIGTDYFGELLESIRQIRASERRFASFVMAGRRRMGRRPRYPGRREPVDSR
jgi:hypothetical protein